MKNKPLFKDSTLIFMIFWSFCLFYSSNLFSQETDKTSRRALLNEIAGMIKEYYIFPDEAKKFDSLLRNEITLKKYIHLDDKELASVLTSDLRLVSKDEHFYVKYLGNSPQAKNKISKEEQQSLDSITNSLANFGFESVKRLEGNIGYINYIGFAEPQSSKVALEAAMNFISNTNSLIIDLRQNRGGDGGMMLLFCSYFIKDKAKVSETYYRFKNENIENWTTKDVGGAKYLNKDVYFLTSGETFSAGEALPYILQNLNLAKVVGEKTGGAANPVDHFFVGGKYLLLIPVGQETNSISKTNWEHIGVIPDEKIESENALIKAHILALKNILKRGIRTELSSEEINDLIVQLETSIN